MAVQLNYIAPPGWKPENPDQNFVIVQYKIELNDFVDKSKFLDAAASVAAESSTGTWTKVDEGADSGILKADLYKALVFDIDEPNFIFKVAYKKDLFEEDNMSGFLAGPAGNIGGMKMVSGLRMFDIRFPEAMVKAFPGPRYGIEGVRDLLEQDEKYRKMPIMGTVPKPKVGRNSHEQAELARRLWTAGDGSYDFIKDDENLTSLSFNKFEDRARLIHEVQRELEEKGGMRLKNPELVIHAHRAMHAFITRESGEGITGKGKLQGFSVSMLTLSKIFRLLGVDSIHTGSPKAKMEDYGESEEIAKVLTQDEVSPNPKFHSLGQRWFGTKRVWPTASGGLHPGVIDTVIGKLGSDCYIQMGGGVLGHPQGIQRGVEAAIEAREAVYEGKSVKEYVSENPDSALAVAVGLWGTEPKIVY
nr:RuBisCO long chain, Form III-like [uncultured bacterium]